MGHRDQFPRVTIAANYPTCEYTKVGLSSLYCHQLVDMRLTPVLRSSWGYVASPSRFGRYPVLQPSMAMTTYPEVRAVPDSIPRPPYVPSNFFSAGWGDHLPGSEHQYPVELGHEGSEGVRKAGKVVAEILKEVEKMVKVSRLSVSCVGVADTVAGSDYERNRPSSPRDVSGERSISVSTGILSVPKKLYHLRQQRYRSYVPHNLQRIGLIYRWNTGRVGVHLIAVEQC